MKTLPLVLVAAVIGGMLSCASPPGTASALDCAPVFSAGGWLIERCANDPNVPASMLVRLNGAEQGQASFVRIAHRAETGTGMPQVAVIYASGYVRLKQNADASPPIPFGSSFVLGPAYWNDAGVYYHNPQLQHLDFDTSWLPDGPLRMRAAGANGDFAITYTMELPPPRDRQTRLHVTQSVTATRSITIAANRRAERQGFKLVQVSSMYVLPRTPCNGSRVECHDSDALRFIAADGARRQVAYDSVTLPGFIISPPVPLGSNWLDVLHTDDVSWQGNTPNVRIVLDELPADRTLTAQGWIAATTNPDDDNVGVWIHDDGPASVSWRAGQEARIGYWLLAQDDPPDPWAELGLRPGVTFLDFEAGASCVPVTPGPPVTAGVAVIAGYSDRALQLSYDLGAADGSWAQIRCNFDPPLDLSAYDHLRIEWRGSASGGNSLQIGLINPAAGGERIFARGYHHVTLHSWWGQLIVPFAFLKPWTAGAAFDPRRVSALFVSVVKDPQDDAGGAGTLAIDNLGAFNVASRSMPAAFRAVPRQPRAAAAAAAWLAGQQRPNGLLKSWEGESACLAYTYDQALALIVFSAERMWAQADRLADALTATQNADGSWYQSRDCETLAPAGAPPQKWEGDIAWATYALSRYLARRGPRPSIVSARDRAADWLEHRLSQTDGCLQIDHTEATIDAWWALHAAGRASAAERLKTCLLTAYWDEGMGRFKGGKGWWQPYLDNQTWGAAFLAASGERERARRALSYAREVLRVPAQGGHAFGFDGQGGPWSVWNEGTAQYIALGGAGSLEHLRELLAQQRSDGAMPGSPDAFSGGGVWTTRWAGVAPTAWLYNAVTREPFAPAPRADCQSVLLPLVRAGR
ncbi:MAG: hypothetical protein RMK84_05855 [Oscillochloridaceae bacterium]|nr:hypothetical protein [Chloroflexaceae bacterium]MDW8389629.1 hypothetical protein [Oscillochloridaceae bacterium]